MTRSLHSLLDVRRAADYLAGHPANAANIPLEELSVRPHELPSPEERLFVVDSDEHRAAEAAAILRERGREAVVVPWAEVSQELVTGPVRRRLWRANPFLIESLELISASDPASRAGRRAIDVACGTGRDAVHLALNGFAVDAMDWLPDALERAADLARRNGVSLQTIQRDVEADPSLPVATYDVVHVARFLHRPLLPALAAAVKPGGWLVYETFHERNRETGRRPTRPEHLLRTGELREAFHTLEPMIVRDEVRRDGRWFSQFLGRRPN